MPLRFRILPASREVRAAWSAVAASSGWAEGPADERIFQLAVDLDEVRVGRQPDLELELPFPAVSSLHARLLRGERTAAGWWVEDLGSMNGTWLDGQRLVPGRPAPVRAGQRLRIATVDLIFEGWSSLDVGTAAATDDSTATIARRLISDLFGVVGGAPPRLTVEVGAPGGTELQLTTRDRRYLVGRADSCDLVLSGEHVSREHAAVIRRFEGVVLQDLGSRNGLLVNGDPIAGERRLADGDRVMVGTAVLSLTDPEDRYLRRLAALGPVAAPEGPAAPGPSAGDSPAAGASRSARPALPGGDAVAAATPSGDAAADPRPPPDPPDPSTDPPMRRRPYRALGTAAIAIVAVLAAAGLVALWLATH